MGTFVQIIEEEEKFEFPIGDSTFFLRRCDGPKVREFERKHTKEIQQPNGTLIKVIDNDAVNDDVFDYMVRDWKDVVDKNQKPLLCERDIKLKLPGIVKDQILLATQRVNLKKVEQEKNESTEKKSAERT